MPSYMRCAYGGKHDHPTTLCPHTWGGSTARIRLYCGYCGSNKHVVKFCPKTYSGESNRRREPNGDFLD